VKYIFIIIIGLFCITSHGQEDINPDKPWSFVFSPSAFFNQYPAAQFGLERKIKNFAVEVEGAYFFPRFNNFESINGYRLKLGLKQSISRFLNINLIFFYRDTEHEYLADYSFGEWDYFQQVTIESAKQKFATTIGATYKLGITDWLTIEAGVSLGYAFYFIDSEGFPTTGEKVSYITNLLGEDVERVDNYSQAFVSHQVKIKYNF